MTRHGLPSAHINSAKGNGSGNGLLGTKYQEIPKVLSSKLSPSTTVVWIEQMCLMSITAPSKNELASAIEASTFQAFSDLFADHKENFYYCTLITTGEGLPPALAAWSWEALNREILKDPQLEVLWIKWSWADSPYLDYGNQYFDTVNSLFSLRPQILDLKSSLDRSDELRFRLEAMEKAMQNLDRRGLFGHGEDRKKIVINAESVPPDHTNTETALRLNPIEALDDWLKENSEPRP